MSKPWHKIVLVSMGLMWMIAACDPRSGSGQKVEIFSWPTMSGKTDGLGALNSVFQTQYPVIEIVNTTANDTEANARRALATRLKAANPPDLWQGHAGQELIGAYVADEQIVALNDLFKQEGWLEVMPKLLFPLISQNGNIYSVPVSIHRANLLWYNPTLLQANGLAVPTTMSEWFDTLDALQAADVTPLVVGDSSAGMELLETVLLSTLGPDMYNSLWDGSADWSGVDVTTALQNYQKLLAFTNRDLDSLSWQDAAQQVINGEAAFLVMGDWVEPYFRQLGKKPDSDYAWVPVPGTTGVFQFLSDSFVLAAQAPDHDAALEWLKVAGSKEGQEAFNSVNGSICARTDCDPTLFGKYQQSAMADWSSNTIVGSLSYGVVVNDAWKSEIKNALAQFAQDGNLETFQSALAAACKDSGQCK
ncbi:MAG TPA: ABC transporter substrate-binding protein [Anaerolineales bacterium]|nr:ABC transporter substrate-binding protein [Anaerolineales bacterium]